MSPARVPHEDRLGEIRERRLEPLLEPTDRLRQAGVVQRERDPSCQHLGKSQILLGVVATRSATRAHASAPSVRPRARSGTKIVDLQSERAQQLEVLFAVRERPQVAVCSRGASNWLVPLAIARAVPNGAPGAGADASAPARARRCVAPARGLRAVAPRHLARFRRASPCRRTPARRSPAAAARCPPGRASRQLPPRRRRAAPSARHRCGHSFSTPVRGLGWSVDEQAVFVTGILRSPAAAALGSGRGSRRTRSALSPLSDQAAVPC